MPLKKEPKGYAAPVHSSSLQPQQTEPPQTLIDSPGLGIKRPSGCETLTLSDVGFFKRPLPGHLIPFNSPVGREMFRAALEDGTLEPYFALCGNYVHQSDVAWCGPSTLAMVLNALEHDPRRVWKFPWRWYTDEQVVPPAYRDALFKKHRGITFDEFVEFSREHRLSTEAFRPQDILHFARTVSRVCRTPGDHLVVAFSRSALGQTGIGHFSPIGGVLNATHVLVMDVARFKYPAYWAPLEDLFRAMQTLDPATNLPRGYIVLKSAVQASMHS
jgi:glutathione gamma-glutamylcysteinyltransferase